MRTTDSIITDLEARAALGEPVQQQINAHRALAVLRAERAEHIKDPIHVGQLDAQIRFWLGHVDEDVDERIVENPKKDAVTSVEALAPVPKA